MRSTILGLYLILISAGAFGARVAVLADSFLVASSDSVAVVGDFSAPRSEDHLLDSLSDCVLPFFRVIISESGKIVDSQFSIKPAK
jgi:hypothetical protein